MFPQAAPALLNGSRYTFLSKLGLTYADDKDCDDEDNIDYPTIDVTLPLRKEDFYLKSAADHNKPSQVSSDSESDDDESDHWKQMSEFMSPTGTTFEMELQHRDVFLGSPLLAIMWDELPVETLYAREALLVSALRMECLHKFICALPPAYVPLIYYHALVEASHMTTSNSNHVRAESPAIQKRHWESAERSCKLLQLALPGFPVEKHLLAQLMIGDRCGSSRLPTSIVIIQALLESYKNNLPEGAELSNLVMHEMEARLSKSQPSMLLCSHTSRPSIESETEVSDDEPVHDLDQVILGGCAPDFDSWLSVVVDLFKVLEEHECLHDIANVIRHLIYEKIMILETDLFCWICGIVPSFTESTLSRAGMLKRSLSSLNVLEDIDFLRELQTLAGQVEESKKLREHVKRYRRIDLQKMSPFNTKFWSARPKKKGLVLGTRDFKDTMLLRVTEYEHVRRSLKVQRRHFDREFSWVLKMVLSSLSSQINTNTN